MDEIKARMNAFVTTFYRLDVRSLLPTLAKTADTEEEGATGLLQLLARLHVDPRQMPQANVKTSDIHKRFFALVSETPVYQKFIQWDGENGEDGKDDRRILWISGGPGVGKTTLLQAIVQRWQYSKAEDEAPVRHVAVFFCNSGRQQQGYDDCLSAVKGLIYKVLLSQPDLRTHLEKMFVPSFYSKIQQNRRDSFDSPGDFAAMSMLLCSIVQDERFQATYLVLDGIEELDADKDDLAELLRLVCVTMELSTNVKWVLSMDRERYDSCQLDAIVEERWQLWLNLDDGAQGQASAELSAQTQIIREYAIDRVYKVGYSAPVLNSLLETLNCMTVPSNLLWTNMALEIVRTPSMPPWHTQSVLAELAYKTPSVGSLYVARWDVVRGLAHDDRAYCEDVLAMAAAAYRPLAVAELEALCHLPPTVELEVVIQMLLPSFLTISQDKTVHFTHLSARDFIRQKQQHVHVHSIMAKRCLALLLKTLRCDCASTHAILEHLGHSDCDDKDTMLEAGVNHYATTKWIQHLLEPRSSDDPETVASALHLLSAHLIKWLGLLGSPDAIDRGLTMIRQYQAMTTAAGATAIAGGTLHQPSPPPQTPRFGYDSNNHDDAHIVGSAPRILQEVVTCMLLYRNWLMENAKDPPQWSAEESAKKFNDQLLFLANFPILRNGLKWEQYSWLEVAPAFNSTKASSGCLHTIRHDDWVQGCCFSPDGRLVASASDDYHLRMWDAQTGLIQACSERFDHWVRGVAMFCTPAANGKVLVAAFDRETIKAWDLVSGKIFFTLSGFPEPVTDISVSPNVDKLAVATAAGLMVWEELSSCVETSKGILYSDRSTIRVEFSPDGNWVASSEGHDIIIRNAREGKKSIFTLSVRAQSKEELWKVGEEGYNELEETEETEEKESNGRGGAEESIDKDGNGQRDDDTPSDAHTNTEFNTEHDHNGEEATGIQSKTLAGHPDNIYGLAFSPDSTFLVSGSDDETARVWDLRSHETVAILAYHKEYINTVAFSFDGSCIATGSNDGTVAIWKHKSSGHWGSGETRKRPDRILYGHTGMISKVAFSPVSSSLLASVSLDCTLRLWDLDMDTATDTNDGAAKEADQQSLGQAWKPSHQSGVSCVAIAPEGNLFASASYDGVVYLWDGNTGERLAVDKAKRDTSEILTMTFSPDEKLLVTCTIDGMALVYNVDGCSSFSTETPRPMLLVPSLRFKHSDWVRDASFCPTGQLIITACDDGSVRVFDVSEARATAREGGGDGDDTKDSDSGGDDADPVQLRKKFDTHGGYVQSVTFSPDGKHLAAGNDDGRVRIWDLENSNGEEREIPDGHDDRGNDDEDNMEPVALQTPILGVAFSDDGRNVVSVSQDGNIAVWTWDSSVSRQRCLRYKIVKRSWGGRIAFFTKMRFDAAYPGVIFTDHGLTCIDLDRELTGDDDDGADEGEEEAELATTAGRWNIPPAGVYDKSVKWNDHAIDLPIGFVVTPRPFSWCVQGRIIVVGGSNGQVLFFRFKEDANPTRRVRHGSSPEPRV